MMIWTVGGIVFAPLGFLAFAGYFDRDVLMRVPATASPSAAHRHLAVVYVSGDAGYRVAMGRKIGPGSPVCVSGLFRDFQAALRSVPVA